MGLDQRLPSHRRTSAIKRSKTAGSRTRTINKTASAPWAWASATWYGSTIKSFLRATRHHALARLSNGPAAAEKMGSVQMESALRPGPAWPAPLAS